MILARRGVPHDASRLAEWWWVLSQNHCSGKPDGVAAFDCVRNCTDAFSTAAPARPNKKNVNQKKPDIAAGLLYMETFE
jgi:hypothetical protein